MWLWNQTRIYFFPKLSGKSQDFYFLVGIHLKSKESLSGHKCSFWFIFPHFDRPVTTGKISLQNYLKHPHFPTLRTKEFDFL